MYISNKLSPDTYQPGKTTTGQQRRAQSERLPAKTPDDNAATVNGTGDNSRAESSNNQLASTGQAGHPAAHSAATHSAATKAARVDPLRPSANMEPAIPGSRGVAAYRAAAFEAQPGVRGHIVSDDGISSRAQQAIEEYQAQQTFTERDHITTVLGIDEYA